MSLNKEAKQAVVKKISERVAQAKAIMLAEYRGISANEMTQLRIKAREQEVELFVIKNTLARLILAQSSFSIITSLAVGPLIYSISKDAVAAARVLNDFGKANEKIVLKNGVYEGKLLDKAEMQELATIPSREQLLLKLLSLIQSPISSLVRVLAEIEKKRLENISS